MVTSNENSALVHPRASSSPSQRRYSTARASLASRSITSTKGTRPGRAPRRSVDTRTSMNCQSADERVVTIKPRGLCPCSPQRDRDVRMPRGAASAPAAFARDIGFHIAAVRHLTGAQTLIRDAVGTCDYTDVAPYCSTNSTRRFFARPSSVRLLVTGASDPTPAESRRAGAM